MNPHLARTLYPWHSWIGVCFGLMVFVLGISGALAVFKDELHVWAMLALSEPQATAPIDTALARLTQAAGGPEAVRRLELPAAGYGYALRTVDGHRLRLDAVATPRPEGNTHGLGDFLVNYHTRLFMGHAGRWLIGGIGIAFLASVLTGLLIHRRIVRELFVQRWGHSPRLTQSDTHKTLGTWGLPFHLVMAITGAWLGLYSLLMAGSGPVSPVPTDVARPPDGEIRVSWLIAETRRRIAGFEPVFVDFRAMDTATGRISVRGNLPGRLVRRHEAGATFEAATGRLLSVDDPARMSAIRRLDLAAAPLHFGDFGGILLRWLYVILGVTGALLALTGTLMWDMRRPGGRNPRHGYRTPAARIVVAAAGGCLVATLALPLLGLLAGAGIGPSFGGSMRLSALFSPQAAPALPTFLLLWLIAAALLIGCRRPATVAMLSLIAGGLFCLLAPLAGALLRPLHGLPALADPAPGVSLALACCALPLLAAGSWLGHSIRRSSAGRRDGPTAWQPS